MAKDVLLSRSVSHFHAADTALVGKRALYHITREYFLVCGQCRKHLRLNLRESIDS